MYAVTEDRFNELIDDALDTIPEDFARLLANVVVLVADRNEDDPTLLGLYEGTPLTMRLDNHAGHLPDTIFIYRGALQEMVNSEEELANEVTITVVHEVAHYFGVDDDRLHELGWG